MLPRNIKQGLGLLLALGMWAGLPLTTWAEWLGFRNDLKQPVVVRTLTVTPDGPRADSVMILYPGEVRWTLVKDANPRLVIIADTKPPRKPMGQKQIPAPTNNDALYGIQTRPGAQDGTFTVDLARVPGQRR